TIGLASFTITGTLSGLYFNPDMWVLIITLGVITAVGGGVIRDVLAGKVPSVLVHDIYATAALLGSVTLYVLVIFDWPVDVAALISFFTTVSSRVVAIKAKLDMPHVKRKRRGQWL
ncbi:MAG: TRIC cation channel family protein, partial [Megasphaera micronuciformis]|nr:TRIC cation channel family protein [Megasphaera micronuciformis]